jgi:hypothetical protein
MGWTSLAMAEVLETQEQFSVRWDDELTVRHLRGNDDDSTV